jgi:hypothetical protein
MQRRLFRVAIGTAIACVVLAPALIRSGQRSQPTNGVAGEDFVFPKEPPVFTVGPPMTAEALAEREMEKRLSLPEAEARAREYIIGRGSPGHRPSQAPADRTSPGSVGGPSLTPADLQKLAAINRGAFQPREDRNTWPKKSEPKREKIDVPLRPLGAEGLTPEERAKLEASRAPQDNAGADEGGRSR